MELRNNKFWFISVMGVNDPPTAYLGAVWNNPQSAMFRFDSVPSTGTVTRPPPLFTGAAADWNHFSVYDDTRVFIATYAGLSVGEQEAVSGTWSWRMLDTSVPSVIGVAVSNDQATVYASVAHFTGSGVWSWNIATGAYNNGGSPILVAPAGFQFRGSEWRGGGGA